MGWTADGEEEEEEVMKILAGGVRSLKQHASLISEGQSLAVYPGDIPVLVWFQFLL